MKACTTASGSVFFIADKMDRKSKPAEKSSKKVSVPNDNRKKPNRILK